MQTPDLELSVLLAVEVCVHCCAHRLHCARRVDDQGVDVVLRHYERKDRCNEPSYALQDAVPQQRTRRVIHGSHGGRGKRG